MKTFSAKPHEVARDWLLIDAENLTLGRMASEIARRLRGKHKPEYTPHVDTGDYVVVVNVEKVHVTGNKEKQKVYYHHSGYPGGIKAIPYEKMQNEHPERILKRAVKGMLPRGPLGRQMFKKLKIYSGNDHPHHAQQPKQIQIAKQHSEVE